MADGCSVARSRMLVCVHACMHRRSSMFRSTRPRPTCTWTRITSPQLAPRRRDPLDRSKQQLTLSSPRRRYRPTLSTLFAEQGRRHAFAGRRGPGGGGVEWRVRSESAEIKTRGVDQARVSQMGGYTTMQESRCQIHDPRSTKLTHAIDVAPSPSPSNAKDVQVEASEYENHIDKRTSREETEFSSASRLSKDLNDHFHQKERRRGKKLSPVSARIRPYLPVSACICPFRCGQEQVSFFPSRNFWLGRREDVR